MLVRISTPLAMPAEAAWQLVQRASTLQHVLRGALALQPDNPFPVQWREGQSHTMRLWFFHVIPGWRHMLRFCRIDDARREILTSEAGGPVRTWNHLISVEPAGETACRYSDAIEVRAGLLTPLVALYARLIYRYRQRRWRKLARRGVRAQAAA